MKKIALTGGIACGKSLAGSILADAGFPVCDADGLAHDLMRKGRPVYESVANAFGPGILDADGEIDRTRLGEIVFADAEQRKRLNALVHPAVKDAIRAWLAGRPAGTAAAVVIIPLLYEAGLETGWDAVICVASPRALQWSRLMDRGLSELEGRRRLAAQLETAEKMNRADRVIFNNGTKERLKEQVLLVLQRLVEE